jgi:glycosyltransferase involved in cell wall biosynthesis
LPALDPRYVVIRPPRALVHRAGHAWEQLVLPAAALAMRARLILSPANMAPLAWPGNVVVIHDAAALRGPQWYSRSYVAWQRAMLPRIARRAEHVVTVSEFSRGEIIDLLGVSPDRVSVIAGAADERFTPAADPRPAREALGLSRPYVLTVASSTARKNPGALLVAAAALAQAGIDLVAAGGGRPQFREAHSAGDQQLVRALGHVPDELLPGLYAGAEAFVLTSLYEGFGLPCLEAMAAGVPVVAADRAALPETCAGAALLVDPQDAEAIAAALMRAVSERDLRVELRAKGLARAGAFSWKSTAASMHALLGRLAG